MVFFMDKGTRKMSSIKGAALSRMESLSLSRASHVRKLIVRIMRKLACESRYLVRAR